MSHQIIYRPEYNFTVNLPAWLQVHPFDAKKYGRIASIIKRARPDISFSAPQRPVSDLDLLRVHTQEQLDRLQDKGYLSRSIDFPYMLYAVPYSTIKSCLLDPMRWATSGTVYAMEQALIIGSAINLGGGYHHAKLDNPLGDNGGCLYADIPLACEKLRDLKPGCRIAIIDLDIHQGNGLEEYSSTRDGIEVFDMYNKNEYPWNNDDTVKYAHTAIPLDGGHLEKNIWIHGQAYDVSPYDLLGVTEKVVDRDVGDDEYLHLLRTNLPAFLDSTQAEFIFYNAGSDPYIGDPWGCTAVSKNGIIQRDSYVFSQARDRKIPIVMTLSGGYAPDSAEVVAASVINLLRPN